MCKVYINREVVSSDISNEALAVYVALRSNYSQCSRLYINKDTIIYELKNSFACTRAFKENIEQGISDLVQFGLISVIDGSMYDISKLYIDKGEKYSYIEQDELYTIMNENTKGMNVFAYLRYAITVLDSIYTTTKYGCISIEDLRTKSKISEKAALSYNKLLEDNGILYIHRTKATIKIDERYTTINNCYGRVEDKHKVIQGAYDYIEKAGLADAINNGTSDIDPNEARSITARYNSYVKGLETGRVFDNEWVNTLREDCVRYNKCNSYKRFSEFSGYNKDDNKDMIIFEVANEIMNDVWGQPSCF